MIDPKLFREKPEYVKSVLATRGVSLSLIEDYLDADQQWRLALSLIDSLKMKRNQLTPKGKPTPEQLASLKDLSNQIKQEHDTVESLERNVHQLAQQLPNIPLQGVPVGVSEEDNSILQTVGDIPNFSFKPKSHDELGISRGIFDFEQATKVTGARFMVGHQKGAQLERALINFMLDIHTSNHDYQEVQVPVIINSNSLFGTGQLPKFDSDLFKLDQSDYWLSPTAEVQLTNLFKNQVIQEDQLPIAITAATACFRKEAGSYGKDVKGIIRQHQFNKVELVRIAHPEDSHNQLNQLRSHAEKILQMLNLPYRVVELCTGDLGFSSAKTFDLEVWFPSQNSYREISSCSNFLDFQSRRAMIRYKQKKGGNVNYVHTINGSGLAVGRTLAAILENYQQADGSIAVPESLKPYLRFDSL